VADNIIQAVTASSLSKPDSKKQINDNYEKEIRANSSKTGGANFNGKTRYLMTTQVVISISKNYTIGEKLCENYAHKKNPTRQSGVKSLILRLS